jgi:hypothetical protein
VFTSKIVILDYTCTKGSEIVRWQKWAAIPKVARWYFFKPKIPFWVNFGGPWNGKGWYIILPFGI